MTIKTLAAKGQSQRAIARQLDLCEGTVRYHLRRIAAGAVDGRSRQRRRAETYRDAIDHWIAGHGDLSNLAALHDWLVAEHDYGGSLRSVQRFVREAYRLAGCGIICGCRTVSLPRSPDYPTPTSSGCVN